MRARFENDDQLHAPQRQQAETVRAHLLTSKKTGAFLDPLFALLKTDAVGHFQEVSWQLTPRSSSGARPEPAVPAELKSACAEPLFAFEDLPSDLRRVLQAQLVRPGDVSAVIETPAGFLLYLTRERTAERLRAGLLAIPKRHYEEWLATHFCQNQASSESKSAP